MVKAILLVAFIALTVNDHVQGCSDSMRFAIQTNDTYLGILEVNDQCQIMRMNSLGNYKDVVTFDTSPDGKQAAIITAQRSGYVLEIVDITTAMTLKKTDLVDFADSESMSVDWSASNHIILGLNSSITGEPGIYQVALSDFTSLISVGVSGTVPRSFQDGSKILFEQWVSYAHPTLGTAGQTQIFLYELDGRNRPVGVSSDLQGDCNSPSIDPPSTMVVYRCWIDEWRIYTTDLNTRETFLLPEMPQTVYGCISWSLDGEIFVTNSLSMIYLIDPTSGYFTEINIPQDIVDRGVKCVQEVD